MDDNQYSPVELKAVTDGVWIAPRDPNPETVQPNVGVITTPTQTVLIDSGNSPRYARRIMHALLDIDAPPVSYVIYTHHHWDHVFGGNVYGAPVIAHDHCREHLAQQVTVPWSHAHIQEAIYNNPQLEASYQAMGRAVEDWRDFRIRLPAITFSSHLDFYLDGMTLSLDHVGGQHADDSITVRVPEAGVLFLGDCFYPPVMHLRQPGDTLDSDMLEGFLDDRIDTYIDGHGDPFGEEGLHERIAEARGGG